MHGAGAYGERGARAGLGTSSPQLGPWAEPLVRESGVRSPLKLKPFNFSMSNESGKNYPIEID